LLFTVGIRAPQWRRKAVKQPPTKKVRLLTRDEAAARAGLSVRSLDRRIAEGTLKATRIGRAVRVRGNDLATFLRTRRTA